ncbi:MAG TPA: hypothetical protein VLK79_07060, partial [Gaiellales bacterium]|nr:hypothetical protein [Gaiellales bacterium]
MSDIEQVSDVEQVSDAALYQGARPAARAESPSCSLALLRRFPPRLLRTSWPATEQPAALVVSRLLTAQFVAASAGMQADRRRGLTRLLSWLQQQPGETWQDRWLASGADAQ